MKIIAGLIQGSKEWLDLRVGYFTASEAPAMLGLSKYKSRSDLVKEKATGIIAEVDDATQRRFNAGHVAEEKMRVWAEQHIEDDLYPVVGVETVAGIPLLASFDGLTMSGDLAWENKLWNAEFAEQVRNGVVPDTHWPQLEQQLLISGAEAVLFTVGDGDNVVSIRYESQPERRERLLAGWGQFANDVSSYVPAEVKEAPKAEAIIALPSVFVQATGMVTASNLAEFKEAATTFIANIKTELISDDDFAQAEATVKFCKDAEGNLESTKASVLAQMSTVDEVVRTLDHIKKQLADKRLMLDKLVTKEKEARKLSIVNEAAAKFTAHIQMLEEEIKPIRLSGAQVKNSFADAIKGKKSLASMQDAVDTALANIKIALDTEAADIRKKLAWCKESSAGFGFLFSDLSILIANNGMEAFQAIVNGRIAQHKAEESAKEEATRLRIQQEEEEKAQAKAKAEQDAIIAKVQAEERARIEAEQKVQHDADVAAIKAQHIAAEEREKARFKEQNNHQSETVKQDGARPALVQTEPAAPVRPSRQAILASISSTFGVCEEDALEWIIAEFAGDIQFESRKAA